MYLIFINFCYVNNMLRFIGGLCSWRTVSSFLSIQALHCYSHWEGENGRTSFSNTQPPARTHRFLACFGSTCMRQSYKTPNVESLNRRLGNWSSSLAFSLSLQPSPFNGLKDARHANRNIMRRVTLLVEQAPSQQLLLKCVLIGSGRTRRGYLKYLCLSTVKASLVSIYALLTTPSNSSKLT